MSVDLLHSFLRVKRNIVYGFKANRLIAIACDFMNSLPFRDLVLRRKKYFTQHIIVALYQPAAAVVHEYPVPCIHYLYELIFTVKLHRAQVIAAVPQGVCNATDEFVFPPFQSQDNPLRRTTFLK